MVYVILLVTIFIFGFAGIAFVAYRRVLRRAKSIERGLKMVPLLIHLPPPSSDTESNGRDIREVMREKISQAEVMYNLMAGTTTTGFKSDFYGQRHIALELIANKGLIHFYAAVPVNLVSVIQTALLTAYPGAKIEEAEDHNVFNPLGKLAGTVGGELILKSDSAYPIASITQLERDPLEGLLNAMSDISDDTGIGVQIMLRPAHNSWTKHSISLVRKKRREGGQKTSAGYTQRDLLMAPIKAPEQRRQEVAQHAPQSAYMSELEQSVVKSIEDKTRLAGFEVLIRVLVSSTDHENSQNILQKIAASFSLFDAPGLNGFKFLPASDIAGLVTAFILRFFPPELNQTILNSHELATLFHLPDAQFTPISEVERQSSKQVDGPVAVPTTGLLLGYNFFRGTKKEIRLSTEDRRRHSYIVGQTGTGKTTLLENLAVQDMLAGNGFAFIDPHGDTAERLMSMIPKNRAEDVIYFNPADTELPLGLNLFEFQSPDQKDFLIQEAIGMLYKLYDPGHTGIIGPRYEHWFRNAALTLMSDPAGATFIEIPKVFTDTDYLKTKFQYLKDPTVIEFWTKEMAQTSDYHKSEMLGWFVSKFGAFQSNEIMRNIIGQPKSAFNLRDVMDNKKILIVNLSKGRIGELNSQLLGMIFVIKFQAAAMGRADVEEATRSDFCLYVDEFQNFSTDSFASILSEARKYHLNLIVANQFIGQLSDQIRDAVFGNVGSVISYRVGPEDADFLVKQFSPVFDAHDLVNIPNHNAVIRLMIGGLPSQPFSITALPPLGVANPELGAAVKQLSAAKFGVNRAQVEQEIFARLSGKPLIQSVSAAIQSPAPMIATMPVSPAPLLPPVEVVPTQTPAQSFPSIGSIPPNITPSQQDDTYSTPAAPVATQTPVVVAPALSPAPAIDDMLPLPKLPQKPVELPSTAQKVSNVADPNVFHVPVDPTEQLAEYAFALDHNSTAPSSVVLGAAPVKVETLADLDINPDFTPVRPNKTPVEAASSVNEPVSRITEPIAAPKAAEQVSSSKPGLVVSSNEDSKLAPSHIDLRNLDNIASTNLVEESRESSPESKPNLIPRPEPPQRPSLHSQQTITPMPTQTQPASPGESVAKPGSQVSVSVQPTSQVSASTPPSSQNQASDLRPTQVGSSKQDLSPTSMPGANVQTVNSSPTEIAKIPNSASIGTPPATLIPARDLLATQTQTRHDDAQKTQTSPLPEVPPVQPPVAPPKPVDLSQSVHEAQSLVKPTTPDVSKPALPNLSPRVEPAHSAQSQPVSSKPLENIALPTRDHTPAPITPKIDTGPVKVPEPKPLAAPQPHAAPVVGATGAPEQKQPEPAAGAKASTDQILSTTPPAPPKPDINALLGVAKVESKPDQLVGATVSPKPDVANGEVFVDDNGNVIQG
ncbi:MAG: hypothetical protein ACHQUB_03090 [Candidatus Saccharimonadia bacterium]